MKLLKMGACFLVAFLFISELNAKCHHHHRTRSAVSFNFGVNAAPPVYVARPVYYQPVTVVQPYAYAPVYMPYQQVIVQQPSYVVYPTYSSGFSFGFCR